MLVPYFWTVVASGLHLQLIHVLSSNIRLYFCCAVWLVALAEGHELNQTNYAHECMAHVLAHLLHLTVMSPHWTMLQHMLRKHKVQHNANTLFHTCTILTLIIIHIDNTRANTTKQTNTNHHTNNCTDWQLIQWMHPRNEHNFALPHNAREYELTHHTLVVWINVICNTALRCLWTTSPIHIYNGDQYLNATSWITRIGDCVAWYNLSIPQNVTYRLQCELEQHKLIRCMWCQFSCVFTLPMWFPTKLRV